MFRKYSYLVFTLAIILPTASLGYIDDYECLNLDNKITEVADNDGKTQRKIGLCLFKSREVKEAAEWFQKAVNNGDSQAMVMLGESYEKGNGVRQDPAKAEELKFQSSLRALELARNADPDAYMALAGKRVDFLLGLFKNKGFFWKYKAIDAYKKLASEGDVESQYRLGEFFSYSRSNKINALPDKEIITYLINLAESGHVKSQYLLGTIYLHGIHSIPQDKNKSFYWYKQASKSGHKKAMEGAEKIHNFNKLKSLALAGNPDAMLELFNYKNSNQESKLWYKLAADIYLERMKNNDPNALGQLYLMFYFGLGVPNDRKIAKELEKKAKELGWVRKGLMFPPQKSTALKKMPPAHLVCQINREKSRKCREDRDKQVQKIKQIIIKMADDGDDLIQNSVGEMYEFQGNHSYRQEKLDNYKKSMQYYQKAVAQGNSIAIYNIGGLYEKGKGSEKNYNTALNYYRQAAQKNFGLAYVYRQISR